MSELLHFGNLNYTFTARHLREIQFLNGTVLAQTSQAQLATVRKVFIIVNNVPK